LRGRRKFFPWLGVRAGESNSEMKIFLNPREGINLSGRQEAVQPDAQGYARQTARWGQFIEENKFNKELKGFYEKKHCNNPLPHPTR